MLPVDRWVIHYGDGSTFTNVDGPWGDARCPCCGSAAPFGVIAVVEYNLNGSMVFNERGCDDSVYVLGTPEGSTDEVKMGLWTDGESYWRVHDLAKRTVTP
jgi:hypothetical protein